MVEITGRSGDQGADLIVRRADGARIVVQAKCWGTSVGNEAVQQAYTACTCYGCQACAVVTNNHFTSSARQVAAKIGCVLIDGHELDSLIRGQLRL